MIPIIDSTNQYLLDRLNHLSSGDVCVAEYQQSGRGRYGRKWFSPFGVNIYLSMYWYLNQDPIATMGLSLVVAIVIAELFQLLGVTDIRVKWPNDIYLYNSKLAGILVECTSKSGNSTQIVIGVGINLLMHTKLSLNINQKWINLQQSGINIDRNELVAKIINKLRQTLLIFECKGLRPFISRWESFDNFINHPVKLLVGRYEVNGIVRGINKQGGLLLEQNGKIESWLDGEIILLSKDS